MSRTKVIVTKFIRLFGWVAWESVETTAWITSAAVVGTAHACRGLARPQREGGAAGTGAEKATVPAGAAEGGAS